MSLEESVTTKVPSADIAFTEPSGFYSPKEPADFDIKCMEANWIPEETFLRFRFHF